VAQREVSTDLGDSTGFRDQQWDELGGTLSLSHDGSRRSRGDILLLEAAPVDSLRR
jgi:hypothetical protein